MKTSKTTKRALLSSVLALVLCFAMLLGTTFAWFTDTASTSVNKIQAGTLDVALEMADGTNTDGTTKWVSAEGKTLNFVKHTSDTRETILWEPGCTYKLPTVRIKNNGNLALKYKIVITGIQGDAPLNEAIDWTFAVSGEGSNTDASQTNVIGLTERSLSAGKADTLTISGTMKTTAGNEYQGLSIDGIAITVYATQDTVEFDSSTNEYDKDAEYDAEPWDGTTTSPVEKNTTDGTYHITSASEFAWMMAQTNGLASIYSNEKIVLDCNVDFGGATITGFGKETVKFGGSFDGQGYTISNFVIDRSDKEDYAGLFNYYSYGTIENLNVKNATVIGQSKVGALLGSIDDGATVKNCVVENCTVVADRKVGGAVGYAQNAAVNNITVKNTTVYCGTTEQAYEKDQWGKVIGYKNTGYSEDGNVAGDDVVVQTGATYVVTNNAAEVATALKSTSKSINVTLTGDVAVDINTLGTITGGSGQYKLGGADTEKINIDLNGHKLTLNTTYWSALGAKNGAAVITVKNGSMNSVGNSANTWNAYDLTFYDCKWNFEDVTFDKAVALATGADTTMKNVIINESNSAAAAYALWITSEGQAVTLDHVTIKSNGGHNTRAIAIKDEYVSAPQAVTLNITDCTFSSTSKAAVLVTSTAGATITASNVNISGVTADSTNLVWVDNKTGYSNLSDVTVNGASVILEP